MSRILGVVRNGLLSAKYGASETTDIYLAAFRIPDFLYGILIMGGIGAVFLPLFAEYMEKDRKTVGNTSLTPEGREAWKFASNLLNILVLAILFLVLGAFLFMPFLIELVAPGFSPEQKALTVALSRFMLLSPIFFVISAIFSGILHYFHKFFAYSLAPILYNLGIIGGILFFAPFFGLWGLALGVVVGAVLHLLIQIPGALKSGFVWQRVLHFRHPSVRRVVKLSFPRTIGAASYYINLIFMSAVASTISIGSITIFTFANDLQYFPIVLFGVSFATAAFPEFSRFFVQNNRERLWELCSRAISRITFLVLPVALIFFFLRDHLMWLIYGTTLKFGFQEIRLAGALLGVFALGVVFQSLIPIFVRAFFAMQNTKTPTFVSIFAIGLNVAFVFFLMRLLSFPNLFSQGITSFLHLEGFSDIRIVGLPLAILLSGAIQFLFLLMLLKRHIGAFFPRTLFLSLSKTIGAVLITGIAISAFLQIYEGMFFPLTYMQVLTQFLVVVAGGSIVYGVSAFLLRSHEMLSLWHPVEKSFAALTRNPKRVK